MIYTKPDIRPEGSLLLCCARTSMDSTRAGQIMALIRGGMDWEYLIWTALGHGMMPLLYRHLNDICPEAVPETVTTRLREHFHANAWRNLVLTEELIRILDLLSRHKISAVPYKGPSLAASIYGNLALRQSGDLDILVHGSEVLRAKDALLSHGYQPEHQLAHGQEMRLPHLQYALCRHDNQVQLELHWQVVPRHFNFLLDLKQLWGRLVTVTLGGSEIPVFSPEDLLLILCLHGSKHLWRELRWLCDVAELIRSHQNMDWEFVMQQTNCLGCERMLSLGLLLANDLLEVVLPKSILRNARADLVTKSLVAQTRARLFSEARMTSRDVVFHLRAMERFRDRARYCLCRAIPAANDRALLKLPELLSFVYYLLRPARLIREHQLGLYSSIR